MVIELLMLFPMARLFSKNNVLTLPLDPLQRGQPTPLFLVVIVTQQEESTKFQISFDSNQWPF
ncbi:MAG: hypothetical protein DMF69_00560 [Acidobacteria bacterium]|nr:MAG: hypothetical protein DMF69_00560 [Acidobacteriota bacterium]